MRTGYQKKPVERKNVITAPVQSNRDYSIPKTIVHVYPAKFYSDKIPPGLGDFLRGSIFLAQYAKQEGIDFKIDLSNHNISNYLENTQVPSLLKPEEFFENYNKGPILTRLALFLNSKDERINLCTNVFYEPNLITSEIKDYINGEFKFKTKYYERVNSIIGGKQYTAVHVRCEDEYFYKEFRSNKLMAAILNKKITGNTYIFSNNYHIKHRINSLFGFNYIQTRPTHTANINRHIGLEGTIIDYILLSKASKIYQFSFYSHGSGFSQQCAVLHNIPYDSTFLIKHTIIDSNKVPSKEDYDDNAQLIQYYEDRLVNYCCGSTTIEPSVLTVYESPYPKMRVGKPNDGGYVIVKIPEVKYSILISGGILDDISFEEDFLKIYKDTRCITYDGSVDGLPYPSKNVEFFKKYIGSQNDDETENLHTTIDMYDNIFIKMDIEGGEIPWFKSLREDQLNKFEQIVIEFHEPFTEKDPLAFEKINTTHVLVHLHANNCSGSRMLKGVEIPNYFECTYLHKRHFASEPKLNKQKIPGPLDMRNISDRPDINIDYPPFVFKS
jgi:hypothetical protein